MSIARDPGVNARANSTLYKLLRGTLMDRRERFEVEVQLDVTTDEYMVAIPQQILNDFEWYEGTELEWVLDGDEIILREVTE